MSNDGRPATEPEHKVRIRLFDADRTDRSLSFDEAMKSKASSRQLLWIDIEGDLPAEVRRALVDRFKLSETTDRALAEPTGRPRVQLHGQHFYVRVAAEPHADHPNKIHWLDLVAGHNTVITRHPRPLEFLAKMNERIADDATIGMLDSAEFVAALLDAITTTYHGAVDRLEDELDEFDAKALGKPTSNELFAELVTIRQRAGRLRRLLAAHRELFSSLGAPDFGRGLDSADADVFQPVTARFEGALASVESTREIVLASFDVLMTKTAQRTNEVMRVLTLGTFLFLPATVTAGFMGMNVIVPIPDNDPLSFWIILGMVLLFELSVIVVARLKGWI